MNRSTIWWFLVPSFYHFCSRLFSAKKQLVQSSTINMKTMQHATVFFSRIFHKIIFALCDVQTTWNMLLLHSCHSSFGVAFSLLVRLFIMTILLSKHFCASHYPAITRLDDNNNNILERNISYSTARYSNSIYDIELSLSSSWSHRNPIPTSTST